MQKVWIYFPADTTVSAQQVVGLGVTEGVVIPEPALADLRLRGVCTDVHVAYPKSAKTVTEGVAHRGFRCPSDDGKSVSAPDTWLQVEVPARSDN